MTRLRLLSNPNAEFPQNRQVNRRLRAEHLTDTAAFYRSESIGMIRRLTSHDSNGIRNDEPVAQKRTRHSLRALLQTLRLPHSRRRSAGLVSVHEGSHRTASASMVPGSAELNAHALGLRHRDTDDQTAAFERTRSTRCVFFCIRHVATFSTPVCRKFGTRAMILLSVTMVESFCEHCCRQRMICSRKTLARSDLG
jgi:hypothetical protein